MRATPLAAALLALAAATAGAQALPPGLDGCPVLPADHVWNVAVDTAPVAPESSAYVQSIGAAAGLHPDFGSGLWQGAPIGIPFAVVSGAQPRVPIAFFWYGSESDPGPYPVPADAPIEGGRASDGDRHVLVVDRDDCVLYELYHAFPEADGSWSAGSGAVFDLASYALRPDGWTSADAAGLPVLPGLARYEEVAAGEIRHALRFTAPRTRRARVWPARHFASSSTDPALPPMGQRFRLKSSFDVSAFSPQAQVILRALQRYGMILADNGSPWYVSGAPDPGWDDDRLVPELARVRGSDFEAVDVSWMRADPDSGRADPTATPPPRVVALVAPNGGERWRVGRRAWITWTSNGLGSVDVALSRDGGATWAPLARGTPDDGSLRWKVTRPTGARLRVRVSAASDPSVADASDADFRIVR
jgi:hypothetical protein